MAQRTVQEQVQDIVGRYNEELLELEETHFQKMMDARIEQADCNILSPFLPSSPEHIQELRNIAGKRYLCNKSQPRDECPCDICPCRIVCDSTTQRSERRTWCSMSVAETAEC